MTAYPVADSVTVDGIVSVTGSIDVNDRPTRRLGIIAGAQDATRSSVGSSISDVLLLSSNLARRGVIVYNDSSVATLRVGLGSSTTSSTSFTFAVGPGGFVELPERFTGEVRGIWSAVDGSARITELI